MQTLAIKEATIPALGLGTWQLDDAQAAELVPHALALGYRHVDTAQIYKNETGVGRGLKAAAVDRDAVFVTTKVWIDQMDRQHFMPSVEESLRKLQLDHVDLLLLHWPPRRASLEENLEQLMEAQRRGLTRHVGVSNFNVDLLARAVASGADVVTNQVEYHPLLDQSTLMTAARGHGVSLTAYSPLACGKLLGEPTLRRIGEAHGKSEVQVGLRWLLQQGNVAAIPKTSKVSHLRSNVDLFDFALTDDEMAAIFALTQRNERQINPDIAPVWD